MFHPYSFYLQKHKNAKIKRESALPFFCFPLLLHLVIHIPDAPNRLLLCPISSFGVSHFTIWDVPFYHLGYPISPFVVSHFTIWGIPFRLLGYPISPFGVSHFTFWDIPFCHLGYPILPFGMSHLTIWDVPFDHLGYPISPFGIYFRHICAQCTARFSVCLLRFFAAKVCVFSFLSIHHVSSGFAWQDKIYFIILSSITLYYHGTIRGIRI